MSVDDAPNEIYIARFDILIRLIYVDDKFIDASSWNAAIERAANVGEKEWRLTEIGNEIRKLKV